MMSFTTHAHTNILGLKNDLNEKKNSKGKLKLTEKWQWVSTISQN